MTTDNEPSKKGPKKKEGLWDRFANSRYWDYHMKIGPIVAAMIFIIAFVVMSLNVYWVPTGGETPSANHILSDENNNLTVEIIDVKSPDGELLLSLKNFNFQILNDSLITIYRCNLDDMASQINDSCYYEDINNDSRLSDGDKIVIYLNDFDDEMGEYMHIRIIRIVFNPTSKFVLRVAI